MAYNVIFRKSAEKEFDALSQGQRKALFEKLKLLERDSAPPETVELGRVVIDSRRLIKPADAAKPRLQQLVVRLWELTD